MKKIVLGFLTLFICCSSMGQTVQTWEPFTENSKKYSFNHYIDADEKSFYVGTMKNEDGKEFYVEKHDKQTGKLIYQKKIDHEIDFAFIFKENIIVIFNEFDKSSDIRTISCSIFSKENGEKVNDLKLTEMKAQLEMGNHSFTYGYSLSPDKSKLLIVPHHTWYINELNHLILFDATKMNMLQERTYKQTEIVTNRFEVNNNGDIAFADNQTVGIIKNKSTEIKLVKIITTDDIILKELKLKFTTDGNIQAACLYKKYTDSKPTGGVFFARINIATAKVENQTGMDFSELITKQLTYNDGYEFKELPGDKSYVNIDLIENNGEWYFIAEHSVRVQGAGRVIFFSHEELVVSQLSSNGKINWVKLLPRSAGANTWSCNYIALNNKLNVIYYDNPKNDEKYTLDNFPAGEIPGTINPGGANIVNVSIDDNGNAIRNVIQTNKKNNLLLQHKMVPLEKNSLLIYILEDKIGKYGTISF